MATPSTVFLAVVIPAVLGGWVGVSKGHGSLVGILLGGLLSYLGVIILVLMKPAAASTPRGPIGPAGWWPDPHQRHQLRYFDGRQWTHHVSDNGSPSLEAET